jgi:hypothetical protein
MDETMYDSNYVLSVGTYSEWGRIVYLNCICSRASQSTCRLKFSQQTKQTPWPLVRKRTISTERPQIVGEI